MIALINEGYQSEGLRSLTKGTFGERTERSRARRVGRFGVLKWVFDRAKKFGLSNIPVRLARPPDPLKGEALDNSVFYVYNFAKI